MFVVSFYDIFFKIWGKWKKKNPHYIPLSRNHQSWVFWWANDDQYYKVIFCVPNTDLISSIKQTSVAKA